MVEGAGMGRNMFPLLLDGSSQGCFGKLSHQSRRISQAAKRLPTRKSSSIPICAKLEFALRLPYVSQPYQKSWRKKNKHYDRDWSRKYR
jgi:hypothetical protein